MVTIQATLDRYIERTVGIVTALNPVIGYDAATELVGGGETRGRPMPFR